MKINRAIEMLVLLLTTDKITAAALADKFEVSVRTVYRDVETLSAAGIPVYMSKGKGGGIALHPNYTLNKALLTDEEKKDVISSLSAMGGVLPKRQGNALQKLEGLFHKSDADWLEIEFSNWSDEEGLNQLFEKLKFAVLEKRKITFHYFGVHNQSIRVAEPLKLCFKAQSWYLYAYCDTRKDYRFFKLSRIKNLCVGNERFCRVAAPRVTPAENEFYDEYADVKLNLKKELAYRVYDECLHCTELPDGSFDISVKIPKGDWLNQYLFGFGDGVTIVSPDWVREEYLEALQKAQKNLL